tara:strand:- start:173 stop:430 length:258 start_codon:yes stop_codon:yes gene_type:complete
MATKEKVNKIKEEELKEVQELTAHANTLAMQIGSLQIQTSNLIKTFNENDAKIVEVKNNLQKTYGEVTIDLNDGSIKESVENDGK